MNADHVPVIGVMIGFGENFGATDGFVIKAQSFEGFADVWPNVGNVSFVAFLVLLDPIRETILAQIDLVALAILIEDDRGTNDPVNVVVGAIQCLADHLQGFLVDLVFLELIVDFLP